MILEVDLHNLITKSKHDRMLSLEPLFNVSARALSLFGDSLILLLAGVALKVRPEMLQKRNLLLELLGVVLQSVLRHNVLLFSL